MLLIGLRPKLLKSWIALQCIYQKNQYQRDKSVMQTNSHKLFWNFDFNSGSNLYEG